MKNRRNKIKELLHLSSNRLLHPPNNIVSRSRHEQSEIYNLTMQVVLQTRAVSDLCKLQYGAYPKKKSQEINKN